MLSNLTSVNALDLYSSERVFEYEIHIRSWDGFESVPSDYDEDLFLLIFGRQACTFTDWAIKSAQELTDQGYSVKTAIMLIDDNGQNKTPAELNALYPQMIVSDNYAENQKDYNNMRSKAVITGSTLPSVFLMNSERKVIFSSSSGEAVSKTAPKVRELLPDGGSASESLWFPLNVTYHQDDARSMLEMINGFRTGDEAWAWNSDDSEKEIYEDLGELTYDYELEKTAMQRAAELAVRFYHTRTDGTSCFTAYPDVFLGDKKAENILKGSENAEMTFTAFREDEMPFSTQAERRNMLSSKYTSVGIGCAEYNGVRYWVQEFSSSVQNTEAVDYEEKLTEVKIPVNQKSCQLQLESDVERYNTDQNIMLAIGETADFPSVSAKLIFDGDVIEDFGILTDYEISDPSLIKIENGEMSALNTGSLTIRWQKEYGSFAAELILNVTILKEHIHDYHVAWEWEEDYSAAKAVFTCRYNSAHTFITDAEVTSEVSREPNCMSDGERCFTASVIYEGKTYTDTRTEVMPATGEHTYTEPEYIWSDDYRRVDAFVICTVCGNRFSEPTWTEYSVVKEPGCEEPGIGRYTADFYDDPFECVTKDVELEPIGHSYQLSEWEWAEDCSSADAVFICEHDTSHVQKETASVHSEIIEEPTCGVDGSGEYRASVTFEGNEYTDEKTAVIPATGNHEITSAEYTWSHDNKTVTAKAICEKCGNEVTETAETSYEVIKEATMDEEGAGRYTAVFENEFFETQTKDVVIPKLSDTLPQSITLDIHKASILFDTSLSLHATVGPDTALDKSVSWSSSDVTVAIVGANGTVR
ncbi:MAG: CAP domain-containing protein, partial [Erysipelotrichaceae bacterium]|nr:CAP domain-containing protein [Erysipelotrichaceae bacterium]